MEKPPYVNPSEQPDTELLNRLEGTSHDPRATELIMKALEMEKEMNMVLSEDFMGMDELARRTSNHVQSLNRRWPFMYQPVTISGWLIDHTSLPGSDAEYHNVVDLDVTSNGFYYLPRIHRHDEHLELQMRSVLQFEYDDGEERQTCFAVPNDVHIEALYQSIDHAESILDEHYPDLIRSIHERLAAIDPQNDLEVVAAFKDFLIPVDPNAEIDAQMLEAVETYLRHYVQLESSLPCYVVAQGNYYQETYKKGEGAKVKKRTSSSRHEDLAYIDKITFRTSVEENNLRMHVPVLQTSLHTKDRDELPFTRQYPLYTITDIMSVRDIPYSVIKKAL